MFLIRDVQLISLALYLDIFKIVAPLSHLHACTGIAKSSHVKVSWDHTSNSCGGSDGLKPFSAVIRLKWECNALFAKCQLSAVLGISLQLSKGKLKVN